MSLMKHWSVHIRPYFIYFYLFFAHRLLFISEESTETILLFVDPGDSQVGHVNVRTG